MEKFLIAALVCVFAIVFAAVVIESHECGKRSCPPGMAPKVVTYQGCVCLTMAR